VKQPFRNTAQAVTCGLLWLRVSIELKLLVNFSMLMLASQVFCCFSPAPDGFISSPPLCNTAQALISKDMSLAEVLCCLNNTEVSCWQDNTEKVSD